MALISNRNRKSKNGREVTLRNPSLKDAEALVKFGVMANSETKCMVTLPEEFTITVADEEKWITKLNESENSLAVVAEINGSIVGMIDFHGRSNRKRLAHTGVFGMALYPEFRNEGIGQMLIEALISWAETHKVIRKIGLAVFSTNISAIHLYKKMGFVEEGRRFREVQLSPGEFIDDIMMYRWINPVN
ncbi:GNAT family N-acetyltransferase [Bdellovibrio bacteriovorus]|uniref:GNAT family N-acetyltransferase n=1 Tax=Bdellovibrio bacteriovorus TaxID=959 RepID=UPI0009C0E700|nr:GNAT family N-acetyltransferase [Bdellovibrio bacteriovorus]